MNPIIFTDFDGVLTDDSTSYRTVKSQVEYGIAPKPFARLMQLAEKTGAKVVVSSNWRRHPNGIEINGEHFANPLPALVAALGDRFAGYLPDGPWKCDKAIALSLWFDEHPDFDGNFVCFDDQDEGYWDSGYGLHFIKTMASIGISDENVRDAEDVLLTQWQ